MDNPTELTAEQARILTDEIRDDVSMLLPKIKLAYAGSADKALGYASWEEYCANELSNMRLPMPQRRELAIALREEGMSVREIGAALNVNHDTAWRDTAPPVGNPTQESDGKDEKIREMRANGASYRTVRETLHVSQDRIARVAGGPGVDQRIAEDAERNQRIIEMFEAGMTKKAIAQDVGVGVKVVTKVLDRVGGYQPQAMVHGGGPRQHAARREAFERMASDGYSAEEIASTLGYSGAVTAREAARSWGITIRADAVMARMQRNRDSTKILRETAIAFDALFDGLEVINVGDVKPQDALEILPDLQASERKLRALNKQLKEIAE